MTSNSQKGAYKTNETIFQEEYRKWLQQETKEDWGTRCKSYSRGCPCCRAWKMFDKTQK